MGRFLIWCAGASPELLGRAERNRYINTGMLIVLVSLAGAGSMFVLSGYAIEGLPVSVRIGVSAFWALIIFGLDRVVATTINAGGKARGMFLYLPRILIALTIAVLVSEPLTSKVFEKEIHQQLVQEANARRPIFEREVASTQAGAIAKANEPVTTANAAITALRRKAEELRAEAAEEEKGNRSSGRGRCGPICLDLKRQAEEKDAEARKNELALPAIQGKRDADLAALQQEKDAAVNKKVDEYINTDGLIARHKALSQYVETEPTAAVIRWTLSLFLLLFELSVVVLKLTGSAYDQRLRAELRQNMKLTDAKSSAFDGKVQEYAEEEIALDRLVEREISVAQRQASRDRQLRLIEGGPWFAEWLAGVATRPRRPRRARSWRTGRGGSTPSYDPSLDPSVSGGGPANNALPPKEGDLVGGRWQLNHEIGSGGYGRVWHAVDTRNREEVAVKISKRAQDDGWWNEVRNTPGGKHMAELLGADAVNRAYSYVVYPYYQPGSLRTFCAEGAGRQRDLAWCLRILEHVVFAVAHAHSAGVVHGDIKADNILLKGGAKGRTDAHVADWGISYQVFAAGGRQRRTHWRWCAPEQVDGAMHVSGELVDLYAIGALGYWLISGRVPIERELEANNLPLDYDGRADAYHRGLGPARLDHLNPEIPIEVADLIEMWTQTDPARRGGAAQAEQAVGRALIQLNALKQHRREYTKVKLEHEIEAQRSATAIPRQQRYAGQGNGAGPVNGGGHGGTNGAYRGANGSRGGAAANGSPSGQSSGQSSGRSSGPAGGAGQQSQFAFGQEPPPSGTDGSRTPKQQ